MSLRDEIISAMEEGLQSIELIALHVGAPYSTVCASMRRMATSGVIYDTGHSRGAAPKKFKLTKDLGRISERQSTQQYKTPKRDPLVAALFGPAKSEAS